MTSHSAMRASHRTGQRTITAQGLLHCRGLVIDARTTRPKPIIGPWTLTGSSMRFSSAGGGCCVASRLMIAASKVVHAWPEVTHRGRDAFITLPCHKTDIVGMCVTRSHPCRCHPAPRLCPFHAMQRHLSYIKRAYPRARASFSNDRMAQARHLHDGDEHDETRTPRRSPTTVQRTCLQSFWSSDVDATWPSSRDSPIDWPLGIRCHQGLRPRDAAPSWEFAVLRA